MEKYYEITLFLKAVIDDKIEGNAPAKNMEYTRQFVEKFKEDNHRIFELYKTRISNFFDYLFDDFDIKEKLKTLDSDTLFRSILRELNAKTANYIESTLSQEYYVDVDTADRDYNLIAEHFQDPELLDIDLKEIEPPEE